MNVGQCTASLPCNRTSDASGEDTRLEIQTDVLSSSIVRCREILVEADDGTVLLHMGRVVDGGGGRIEVKDASGENTVAIGTRQMRSREELSSLIQKAVFKLFLTELIKMSVY